MVQCDPHASTCIYLFLLMSIKPASGDGLKGTKTKNKLVRVLVWVFFFGSHWYNQRLCATITTESVNVYKPVRTILYSVLSKHSHIHTHVLKRDIVLSVITIQSVPFFVSFLTWVRLHESRVKSTGASLCVYGWYAQRSRKLVST